MLRSSMMCSVIGKLLFPSFFKSFKRGFIEVTLTWRQIEKRLDVWCDALRKEREMKRYW